jgi:predicted RNase H-like HicB family nuclease
VSGSQRGREPTLGTAFATSRRAGEAPTPAALREAYTAGMRSFPAVVERCPDTGLFVGHVPGFAGAHTQAASLDELQENLREVIALLLEEGEPTLSSELVGVVQVQVP